MVHKNVYLTIVASMALGLADSIWTNTILTSWLYILADNSHANSDVGTVEAAQGLAQLVTALPIGYLADKWARAPVIKMGCIISSLACATTLFGILNNTPLNLSSNGQFYVLLVSMCLWGVNSGVFNGPIQALFADSIPAGERSKWYTYLMTAYIVPSVVGPIITVIFFDLYGDNWSFDQMRPIFITGVCMELLPTFLTLFLQDVDKNIPPTPTSTTTTATTTPFTSIDDCTDDNTTTDNTTTHTNNNTPIIDTDDVITTDTPSPLATPLLRGPEKGCFCVTRKRIPFILFFSSLMAALGSGMSVKFFPLFFKEQLSMPPSQVQIIYALTPISMALLSVLATALATRIGRVQVSVYFQLIGIGFLVLMAVGIDEYGSWVTARPWLMVAIYIIRTGLMNCTYPLQESIMMDCVAPSTRARWKSLEAIGALGWSGSAALGGVLADEYSYSRTFLVTAGFQFTSCLMLFTLVTVVPITEKHLEQQTRAANNMTAEDGSLQSPLIAVASDD